MNEFVAKVFMFCYFMATKVFHLNCVCCVVCVKVMIVMELMKDGDLRGSLMSMKPM